MTFVNAILNFAALLLWIGWRDLVAGSLLNNAGTPLVRTLRRAGDVRVERGRFLGGLGTLLVARAVAYWWLGAAVNWTPHLDLTAITIPFRSEIFFQMLLFSMLSFGAMLGAFYLSLIFFSLANHRAPGADALQKFIRAHLGRVDRWPFALKMVLPFAFAAVFWTVAGPLLAHAEILPRASSFGLLLRQGLLLGVAACLEWKFAAAGILVLHFLNSYVHFGEHPFWEFVNFTARRMLTPLRRLPLRAGRMDFAPLAGVALVFLAAMIVENGAHTAHHQIIASLRERYGDAAR